MSSLRPTKRQKRNNGTPTNSKAPISAPVTPAAKARNSRSRPVLTYGSQKKNKRFEKISTQSDSNSLESESQSSDQLPVSNDHLIDSAYQSMSTTHEDLSEKEVAQDRNATPRGSTRRLEANGSIARGVNLGDSPVVSRKKRKIENGVTPPSKDVSATVKKTLRKGKKADSQQLEAGVTEEAGGDLPRNVSGTVEAADDEDGSSVPNTRSSRRVRKKTWKQTVAEAEHTERSASKPRSLKSTPARGHSVESAIHVAAPVRVTGDNARADAKTDAADEVLTPRKRGRPRKNPESTPQRVSEAVFFEDIKPKKSAKVLKRLTKSDTLLEAPVPTDSILDPSTPGQKRKRTVDDGVVLDIPATVPMCSQPPTLGADVSDELEKLKLLLTERESAEAFMQLKEEMLLGLLGKKRLPLVGLDNEYQKVHQLVEQTVVAGEGNSMLVIGARGTAKTTLVETVISRISEQHQEDFHVIRLSGFVHTDDKVALREIWRQLGKEMQIEDETGGTKGNYADTLASLLAILSHPEELSGQKTDQVSKSVIFILDEFDLFASHPRQTLLYNLFDIAQSRKAPIAVLGLTTRIEVAESLEKRVKSRFSHRYVHLSHPRTYLAFTSICKAALCCESKSSSKLRFTGQSASSLSFNNATHSAVISAWTTYVSAVLASPRLSPIMQRLYAQSKSVPSFLSALVPLLASCSPTEPPTASSFSECLISFRPPDSKLSLLKGLADLELALLIAAARLDIILDTDSANFNLAYDEYARLVERARITGGAAGASALGGAAGRLWGVDVALGSWEKLSDLGLLVPAAGAGSGVSAGGGGGMDLGKRGRLWKVDVSLEEIGASGVDMPAGMAKWCREI